METSLGLGSDHSGDGPVLAPSRQKRRWWTGANVAGFLVGALGGLDVDQDVALPADGGIHQPERGGAAVSGCDRAAADARARSLEHRSRRAGHLGGGEGRNQCLDHPDGRRHRFDRWEEALLGQDGARTSHPLSERARHLQRDGPADQAELEEAHPAGREGGPGGDRAGERDLPQRHSASSVGHNQASQAEAAGADPQAERASDRDNPGSHPAGERALWASQAESRRRIETDGGRLAAIDPADQALDEDGPRGGRQDHPRRAPPTLGRSSTARGQ